MLRSWKADPGMSKVSADGIADDGGLGCRPTDPGGEQVPLQAQEGTNRQPDVVPLRYRRPCLTPLRLRVLLDPPVIRLDRPAEFRQLLPPKIRHLQVAGRPVRNVAVWGDYLEYLDQPVPLQPGRRPRRR